MATSNHDAIARDRLRSNTFTFEDESGSIQSITYIDDSLDITSDQPSEPPPTIDKDGNVFTITLEAGRQASGSVATSFVSRSGGDSSKVFAPFEGGGTPGELNFYFGVTLQFESTAVTVYLGQGNHRLRNNWWIGGSAIFSDGDPRLEYTAGNRISTLALSGDVDSLTLELVDVRPVSPLTNVFVLMLENHSFDNMLALSGIPGIIAATGADSNSYEGTTFPFGPDAPESMPTDPGHEFPDVVEQLAGQGASYPPGGPYPAIDNSGFVANYATTTTEGPTPPEADIGEIMLGFDTATLLPVLHELASQFVVCDQWFSSLPGPTWPNRFFLHGASSAGLDSSPTRTEMLEWETVDGFRYPNGSIFDAMDGASITWRLYQDDTGPLEGRVPLVAALHGIDVFDVHPLSTLETDLQQAPYPYQYTFIEPSYGDFVSGTYEGGSSQHPMDSVAGGEALIARVYELIRNSPVWQSSALVITYDEHGGFYDHVAPHAAPPPDDGSSDEYNKYGFDFAQYGVRVPAVVVSPLVAGGEVDHTLYDHSSVLATLEWLFGLSPLTARDAAANNLMGLITRTARTDCPTTLPRRERPASRRVLTGEERAALDQEVLPDHHTLMGFLGVLLQAHSKLAATPEERAAGVERFRAIRTRGDAREFARQVMARIEAARTR